MFPAPIKVVSRAECYEEVQTAPKDAKLHWRGGNSILDRKSAVGGGRFSQSSAKVGLLDC